MNFDQLSSAVVNFLPESDCLLAGIHFLYVSSPPVLATGHFTPVASAPVWQIPPLTKLPLILVSRTHQRRAV